MLVSEAMSLYMQHVRHKATYKVDIYVQRQFELLWGSLDVHDFTIHHLNKYKNKRLLEARDSAFRRELSLMKRSWKFCLSEGHDLPGIFHHFRMPPNGNRTRRIPSDRELRAVLQYTSPQISALIKLGIETCCRRSEILGIRKEHINFPDRTLYIPVSKTGDRAIPLSKKALKILKDWNYQFTIRPCSISSNVSRVCKRLGIQGICFHSITRHYGTTRLLEKGFSVSDAATVTGHTNPITLHRYTHLSPSKLAQRLD